MSSAQPNESGRAGRGRGNRLTVAVVASFAAATMACSSTTTTTEAERSATTVALEPVHNAFCDDVARFVSVIDTYGRVFTEEQLTVGELKSRGDELQAAHQQVTASAGELAAAITATNQAATKTGATNPPGSAGPPATTGTTTTILRLKSADEHQAAITKAEKAFGDAVQDADPGSPLKAATASVHAAAFGVEQTYVSLFVDAGCLDKDAKAASLVNRYVSELQQDLTTLGFYQGTVDGLYGPDTVAAVQALQASAGIPQSGVVDPATEAELARQIGAKGKQQALSIAALQGALQSEGFYTGPIDGTWTPELEAALKAYQTAQSLPPTGAVDAATLAALLHKANEPPSTTTTAAVATTSKAAPTTVTVTVTVTVPVKPSTTTAGTKP